MIEIVCPSCGARYQVPDDSIGPEGRKVTCSSCSHKWRAYPQGAPTAAEGATEQPPETVAAEAGDSRESEAGEQPPSGDREAQMDAIRRMLDDLKRSADEEPEATPEPEPAPQRSRRPESTMRRREEEEEALEDLDDSGDPLRSRIARMGNEARPGKEAARASNYDAVKLRKMHEKRAKRLQKAKERRRGSGAFLTGFTLVAAVAAVMVGLYVLQPQIVASSPEMAPAMNEYVVTVDRYRVALDEATANARAWVAERADPLLGGEEAPAEGGSGEAQPAETAQ